MFATDFIIDRAYKNALRIPLKKDSKFIIFSDLHKGKNNPADDFRQNRKLYQFALQSYFDQGFTYIEAGDGVELWENTSFAPIYYTYETVFKLLKNFYTSGRLYMLWGNHDMVFRNPRKAEEFFYQIHKPKNQQDIERLFGLKFYESLFLEIENSHKGILVLHGHQADYLNYIHWKVSRFFVRYFWRYMQKWFGIKDPTSPAKNHKSLTRVEKRLNHWIAKNQNQPVICGHTHRPRFPEPGNIPLFNDGSCVHPGSITGIEIVNQQIALVKWYESADKNREKKIVKVNLEDPVSLFNYF